MMTDPFADMLTRIRNALARGHAQTRVLASRLLQAALETLVEEGYLTKIERIDLGSGKAEIIVTLRYHHDTPAMRDIRRVSRPGRRVYAGVKDIPVVRGGLGVSLISTSKGVMSGEAARKEGLGGEVLCSIF